MAKRITLTDDITPTVELPEGTDSTRITLSDGRESFSIEIDLGDDNFRKLVTALRKYKDHGRAIVVPEPATKTKRDSESDGPKVRAWAQAHPELLPEGVAVPGDRGALSKAVLAAYDAHNGTTDPGEGQDTADATDVSTDV